MKTKFNNENIDQLIQKMSLKEKVGQLFMTGILDNDLSNLDYKRIHEYKIGSFILFSKNTKDPESTAKLNMQLHSEAKNLENEIPFFIAIDQEQGIVMRLEKGMTIFPGNYAIGQIGDENIARKVSQITGNELMELGINVNLAPVADINSNPKNPIIGSRSFGEDEYLVCNMVKSSIKGFHDSKILSCAKHFPGHGDVTVDSHIALPIVDKKIHEIQNLELKPFEAAIEQKVPMIMTAHILFKDIDSKYPATASKQLLEGILRKQMGFQGIIISDDLQMKALTDNYDIYDLCIRIIQAGCDMLIYSDNLSSETSFDEIYDRVYFAFKNNIISEKRLNTSLKRILYYKKQISPIKQLKDNITSNLSNKDSLDLSYEIMRRAIKTNKDSYKLPIHIKDKNTIIISDIMRFTDIFNEKNIDTLLLNKSLKEIDIENSVYNKNEILIFLSNSYYCKIFEKTQFKTASNIYVFSLTNPYLKDYINFNINIYINLFAYRIPLDIVLEFFKIW